jgi:uncharacterized protein
MPVAPTYPGVYIEEIPSGVHTITGVATSITAFVGYTSRGSVNRATHIFSYADFERAFGGLAVDSPLSYAVKHFFQNGGTEAYVVRAAAGAVKAGVTLKNKVAGGASVLEIEAASEGAWGNNLRIDVDYATSNPASLFNLHVTELVDRNGQMVPGRTETFRNLSMDSLHPGYVVGAVNALSDLIKANRPAFTFTGNGKSTSGVLTLANDLTPALPPGYKLAYMLNGQGPFEITVATPTSPGTTLANALTAIRDDVVAAAAATPPGLTGALVDGNKRLEFTAKTDSAHPSEHSSVHFLNASSNSVTARLKLGTANGGIEEDAAAAFRPQMSGTIGTGVLPTTAAGELAIDVLKGASSTAVKAGINVPIWGTPTAVPQPATMDELVEQIRDALVAAAVGEPLLVGATAQLIDGTLRIVPSAADPNVSFDIKGATATTLKFTAAGARNVARYAPGVGVTALAQVAGAAGNSGTPPVTNDILGSESAKSGIYALEDVDLFNLLVIPEASKGAGDFTVLQAAIAYCVKRRAFMIIDVPENYRTFAQVQAWIGGTASPLRSRNAALYFPRIREPDPLKNNLVNTFPAAGALAGLFARTDAERGIWKAPAGTSAALVGATSLSYSLTDRENGALNPLGLNCLRTFPIYGNVSWGARTGKGADAAADEYKYVPVRRLALFLEESLYRGTQWAVFEPNDEPLWAQIRLNLGAFMHQLFSQGAFQGRTPRDAYFVKCDKETTTQNDIDLGRVNIVVGFAPLKPAEFVIIQIQQIAGAIQT